MKYCEECGAKLQDNESFCSECGAKCSENLIVDDKGEVESNNGEVESNNGGKKRKKTLAVVIAVALVAIIIGVLGYFVIYPKVMDYLQDKEDQKAAQKVIHLIDSLDEKKITADSEKDLDHIKTEYDALSKDQKKLVSNYDDLKGAYKRLEEVQDQKAANSIVTAIDEIDKDSLTAGDTSVQAVRDKYNELSEAQKKLVTNINTLEEYEQLVQTKKAEEEAKKAKEQETQAQKAKVLETFENLKFYEGVWGDFGAHVNQYQGMVESAIKNSISLSNYFGDVNNVYMVLELRVMNDDVLANGLTAYNQIYTIYFEGPSVTGTGGARHLECTVSSPNGTSLAYNETSYY